MLVQPGERVLRGTPLFEDKKRPGVRYRGAGGRHGRGHPSRRDARVPVARHRRRSRTTVPTRRSPSRAYAGRPPAQLRRRRRSRAARRVGDCGRRFAPGPSRRCRRRHPTPHAIFVTAIDTHPHAPAVDVVLAGREADFHAGLARDRRALRRARPTSARRPGRPSPRPRPERIRVEEFAGPHPAGTPGLHIHLLDPGRPRQGRLAHRLPGRRRDRPARHDRQARRRARGLARRAGRRRARACCARGSGASTDALTPRRARRRARSA